VFFFFYLKRYFGVHGIASVEVEQLSLEAYLRSRFNTVIEIINKI